jgi:sporulation protein YlmC with PRC-barrel domain
VKTTILTVFVMLLAVTTARSQQTRDDRSTNLQAMTPIAGIDEATFVGSARASRLIGSKVYQGGTSVGQIEDVIINLDHATVTAVILSVGGFLGIGNKLVAAPVNQIKVGSEAKFTTDLTKEQLINAPAFDFDKVK